MKRRTFLKIAVGGVMLSGAARLGRTVPAHHLRQPEQEVPSVDTAHRRACGHGGSFSVFFPMVGGRAPKRKLKAHHIPPVSMKSADTGGNRKKWPVPS